MLYYGPSVRLVAAKKGKGAVCFIGNYNLPSSCAEQLLWRCVIMADSLDASWSWNKNQNAIVF
jgi:hypothetical protein